MGVLTLATSDCYAIAAGMIAGEGLGGIVGAVLQVAKVSGNIYGSKSPTCALQGHVSDLFSRCWMSSF
jgi:hypothetical protein